MLDDPGSNPPRSRPSYGIYAYTAREWDPEINLYYYRARYYDPKIGRFISEDPMGILRGDDLEDSRGFSLYAYVENRPTVGTDPLGLVIQICNRPAEGMPGNHAYLLNPATGENCGRGENSGQEDPCDRGTACIDIPGTEGREDVVLGCCEAMRRTPWASSGMFRPFTNDCHNFINDVMKCAELRNPPSAPGGRTGPTRPAPPDQTCVGGVCWYTSDRGF